MEWQVKTSEMLKPIMKPIKRSEIPLFVLPIEKKKELIKRTKNLKRKIGISEESLSKKTKIDEDDNDQLKTNNTTNSTTSSTSTSPIQQQKQEQKQEIKNEDTKKETLIETK